MSNYCFKHLIIFTGAKQLTGSETRKEDNNKAAIVLFLVKSYLHGNFGLIYQMNLPGFGLENIWLHLLCVWKPTSQQLSSVFLISALWGVRDEGETKLKSARSNLWVHRPEEVNWLLSVRGGVGGKHLTADRQTLALQGRAGSTLLDIISTGLCSTILFCSMGQDPVLLLQLTY